MCVLCECVLLFYFYLFLLSAFTANKRVYVLYMQAKAIERMQNADVAVQPTDIRMVEKSIFINLRLHLWPLVTDYTKLTTTFAQ